MTKVKGYGGLDRFRVIAAFLIVAIHTSPLVSYSEMGDFVFSRVIARVGVPFFLMVSGYFLLPQYFQNKLANATPMLVFLKKLAILYGVSTLIYLPVSIYAGYYDGTNVATAILKNVFMDGTFYHLWYFPCTIFGAGFVWFLSRKLPIKAVLAISICLYIIGLFGDSYYGLLAGVPIVKNIYDMGFMLFSYTRNGLFYAPIFLVLGGCLALSKRVLTFSQSMLGCAVSMIVMIAEGVLLHSFEIQRHDSMYFTLPICSFFLFQLLLSFKGKGKKSFRTLSMWIYIIHPLFIVLVRGFAKVAGLVPLLVENSLIHYLAVSILSFLFSLVITVAFDKRTPSTFNTGRAWIELDMSNLRHNYVALKKLLPQGCQMMPAVKANAYGHGALPISRELNSLGVKAFCVATVLEAVELRRGGISGEILILGYTHPQQFYLLHKYSLTQTAVDCGYAMELNSYKKKLHVHVKIDTGMHRQGERCENINEILQIFNCKNLLIDGIFTHMCVADSQEYSDIKFTHMQMDAFSAVLSQLKANGVSLPKVHMQSSYGAICYPEFGGDYSRIGIAIYGLLSNSQDTAKCGVPLLPVLSIRARISTVKKLLQNEGIGYGLQFVAPCDMLVAVVTIGYGDGLPRCLSCNVGQMLVNGSWAPILGRICMDQAIIDVTHIPGVKSGDIAVVVGKDGEKEITVCDIAQNAGTISNEILSNLSTRLERVIVDKK